MNKSGHYVYIIECLDSTIYTGYTTDINRRMTEHKLGAPTSAKYVLARGFSRLLYVEDWPDRSAAMKREYEIKQLSRQQKLELIRHKKTAE